MKVEATIHFKRRGRTKKIRKGQERIPPGVIPRVAKLMALAIRFEELIKNGDVADYAELARLAHVSRARITQSGGAVVSSAGRERSRPVEDFRLAADRAGGGMGEAEGDVGCQVITRENHIL